MNKTEPSREHPYIGLAVERKRLQVELRENKKKINVWLDEQGLVYYTRMEFWVVVAFLCGLILGIPVGMAFVI